MSLINQMLQDLEKRRADSVAATDSPLKGVNRYSVVRQRPGNIVYVLITALMVLAGLAGFLGWAYLNNTQQQDSASAAPAVKPDATGTQQQAAMASSSNKSNNAVVARVGPQVKTDEPKEARPSRPSPVSEPKQQQNIVSDRKKTEPEDETAADSKITKRVRPLSGEQQAELAYKQGYRLLSRGRQEAAEQKLREALAAHRQHLRARELLAGVYIKAGRYVEAAELLKQGVALAPEYTVFTKLYARVLLEQNNIQSAIQLMERFSPPPAVDTDYHALLAVLYQRAGQYLKSAARYRDVLRVNPNAGSWWIGLGVSLEQLGKYEEAQSAYQRAKNSGNLTKNLMQYTDDRIAALRESGYHTQ